MCPPWSVVLLLPWLKTAETNEDIAGPDLLVSQKLTADIGKIRSGVSHVKALLKELRALCESLQGGDTLADLRAADAKAVGLQNVAYVLLDKRWKLAEFFPGFSGSLDDNERRLVTGRGRAALGSRVLGEALLKDVTKKVNKTTGEVGQGVETPFSGTLIRAQLDMAIKLMMQEEARADMAKDSADYLEKTAFKKSCYD